MVMHYHWGLAVGHLYAHSQNVDSATTPVPSNSTRSTTHGSPNATTIQHFDGEEHDTDQPDLDDDDDDDWEDVDGFDNGQVVDDFSDDDMTVSMVDMYGEE